MAAAVRELEALRLVDLRMAQELEIFMRKPKSGEGLTEKSKPE
jgi:hypothetical protein